MLLRGHLSSFLVRKGPWRSWPQPSPVFQEPPRVAVTVTAPFVTSDPQLSAYDNNKLAPGGSGAQEQLTWVVAAPGALMSEVGSGCPTVRAGPRLAEPHRRCSRTHLVGGRWFSAGGLSASRHGLSKRPSGCPHVTGVCPPERMIQASAVSVCHDLVSEVTPPLFLQGRAGGTGRRVPSEGSTRGGGGGTPWRLAATITPWAHVPHLVPGSTLDLHEHDGSAGV